jgi:hypothetical protein
MYEQGADSVVPTTRWQGCQGSQALEKKDEALKKSIDW